jgi:O-antigen ligase
MRLANQTGFQIWQYYGTIGTLLILVAYALVNVRAVRHLAVHRARENLAMVVRPALAVLFVLYISTTRSSRCRRRPTTTSPTSVPHGSL